MVADPEVLAILQIGPANYYYIDNIAVPIIDNSMEDKDTFSIPIQDISINIMGMKCIQQFSWLFLKKQQMLCMIEQE